MNKREENNEKRECFPRRYHQVHATSRQKENKRHSQKENKELSVSLIPPAPYHTLANSARVVFIANSVMAVMTTMVMTSAVLSSAWVDREIVCGEVC